ncbi:TetR/AcrR family transcriptional regulator [Streptomyces sp. 6N223]|uniref:TetR/AcrR family transcriptional regulator n=1 Tax=Streptomyces sp. 6N223 TaxID=3457412 RepID=UPI003FCF6BFA
MPTARESLLEAARNAVERRPWPVVRMVEVAAAAGVSRQTLYNEFGDKAGLGIALVDRQVRRFLDGFSSGLTESLSDPPEITSDEALARAADWMLWAARRDRMVRATLTGCQSSELPPSAGQVGQPGQLVAELRDRALGVLARRDEEATDRGELAGRCETAIRLALSHLVAPAPGSAAPGHVPLPRTGWRLDSTANAGTGGNAAMQPSQRAALSRPRGAPE